MGGNIHFYAHFVLFILLFIFDEGIQQNMSWAFHMFYIASKKYQRNKFSHFRCACRSRSHFCATESFVFIVVAMLPLLVRLTQENVCYLFTHFARMDLNSFDIYLFRFAFIKIACHHTHTHTHVRWVLTGWRINRIKFNLFTMHNHVAYALYHCMQIFY